MPLIIVGADTKAGTRIVEGIGRPEREVRVFVTDESRGAELKGRGFKVAIGDVSDDSHIGAASLACFSAVLVAEAAHDSRERAFAETPDEVLSRWAEAVANAGVTRAIWVVNGQPPQTSVDEVASVAPDDPALAERIVALDNARSIK